MRITHKTTGIVMSIAISVLLASVISVLSGTLDSPGAPSATSSYTLEDIYNRLNVGKAGTQSAFTEPAAGPVVPGAMHTLIEIMGKAPVLDDVSGAAVGDVLAGKTFWGRTSGEWGPRIGTLATQTLSATNDTLAAGYYAATTLSAVDTDLVTGNIKSGTTIFGVAGKTEVVDTTSGDAVAGNILSGKKAWVAGAEITGTIAPQTLSAANDTVTAGYYAATTLSAVDTDLATGNIKSGTTIFGVAGKTEVVDTAGATALQTDIITGKTAFVGGNLVTGNVTAGANVTGGAGSKIITIPDGLYSGSKTATATDVNLAASFMWAGK